MTTKKGVLFKHDADDVEFVDIPTEKDGTESDNMLDFLYETINCNMVECFAMGHKLMLYFDEEGHYSENKTRPNHCLARYSNDDFDMIYGNALLICQDQESGKISDVTQEDVDTLKKAQDEEQKKREEFYKSFGDNVIFVAPH